MSIAILIAVVLAVMALLLILDPQSNSEGPIENRLQRREFISSKHKWEKSELKGLYTCHLCSKLMTGLFTNIFECKKCGILIHHYCKIMSFRKPDCKFIIASSGNSSAGLSSQVLNRRPSIERAGELSQKGKNIHQWRQGIHSFNSICSYCELLCTGFDAFVCLWCHRIKHRACQTEDQCDLGTLRKVILAPNQIKCSNVFFAENVFQSLRKKKRQLKQKTSDDSETELSQQHDIVFDISESKSPVVVVVNKKSGGQAGNQYLKAFYYYLNPLQVISILDEGLERLKLFKDIKNLRIVVGGGDGTVCSVMNYLTSGVVPEWIQNNPPVAVFPLGTGNDLSRALGWGGGSDERDAKAYLEQLKDQGKVIRVDRWKMTISSQDITSPYKTYTIYNYLGIGLDAKVCFDFHKMRQKYPSLFVSQFSNKIIYTQMGVVDFVGRGSVLLKDQINVTLDGKELDLTGLENLVFMNITHWAGGASNLWLEYPQKKFKKQLMNDGQAQILGVTDMLHLGQIQVGLDLPLQIAQGSRLEVKSKVNCSMAFQIDGEPFEVQAPFNVVVEYKDKVNMLATQHQSVDEKVMRVLSHAFNQNVIDQKQYRYLIQKLES